MSHYIGTNDRETLAGVVAIIDRRLRSLSYELRHARTVRDRNAKTCAISELDAVKLEITGAMGRGPTPTPAQLASLKVTIPEVSRLKLKIARVAGRAQINILYSNGTDLPGTPRARSYFKYKLASDMWSPPFDSEQEMLTRCLEQLQGFPEDQTP